MIFYGYTTFSFIQSSTDGHLVCFNFLAIMYNAAMNVQVQVFVCTFFFISPEYIPKRTAGSYDKSMFNHLENCHFVF